MNYNVIIILTKKTFVKYKIMAKKGKCLVCPVIPSKNSLLQDFSCWLLITYTLDLVKFTSQ